MAMRAEINQSGLKKSGLKILHVIDSGGLYGAELMLLNLIGEQKSMELEPILLSIGEPSSGEKAIEQEARRRSIGLRVLRMKPGFNLYGALDILKIARSENIGLIHSHGYKADILLGFLPRSIRKIPVIATLHGWTGKGSLSRLSVYEWLDRKSLKRLDSIVAVSQAMVSRTGLKGDRVKVVSNGIAALEPDNIAGKHIDEDIVRFCRKGTTIGAIGRLSPEKGFDLLIQALKTLTEKFSDIRLVIVGEGGERKNLEALASELGLEERVLLPGYRDRAYRLMPYFKVFAISSHTEGLPICLLESMQCGVPVIATRVGSIPEVLEEGRSGILVNPGSAEALAEGIESMLKDSSMSRSIAERARERALCNYSSRRMAADYMTIYSSLVGTQG